MTVLREAGHGVVGLDRRASPTTTLRADLTAPDVAGLPRKATAGVDHVLHTATLHEPHVGTHSREDFVDVNATGTLRVLDAHLLAAERAPRLAVARLIVSATTPFTADDRVELGRDAAAVVARRFPDLARRFVERG